MPRRSARLAAQQSRLNTAWSCELSRPLVDLILCQRDSLPHDVIDAQCLVFKQLSQAKHQCQVDTAKSILSRSPPTLRRAIECCQEKGASSWLSALPIERHDTGLLFIRQTSLMLFVCVMAGFHPTYLPTVSVAKPFLFPMLLAALMVLFPSSAIMTFAT